MLHTNTPDVAQQLTQRLLNPHQLSYDGLKQQAHVAAIGADFADIYLQHTEKESWYLDESIIKSASFGIHQGVGVRSVYGDKTAFAYSDQISASQIAQLTQAHKGLIAPKTPVQALNLGGDAPLVSHYQQIDVINSMDSAEKVAILQWVDQYARTFAHVYNVSVSLAASYDHFIVARSDERMMGDIKPMVRLSLQIMLRKGDQHEVGNAGGGGRVGLNYFSHERLKTYVDEAMRIGMHNLDAQPAPAGTMDVVLGSGWPGILLHEAIGHGLEADFNRKQSSVFSQKMGTQIAAKGVYVMDDGTLEHRRGSLHMDDEGNPAQANLLIEDGKLVKYLQDETNARLMNLPVTGNGRRESYASIPLPRMTNTYMLAGEYSPEEIIASIDYGIYANEFGGGQVDITNGKFVFSASQAFLIEKGKITRPLKGATLIGSGEKSLQQITMIGNDMTLDSGIGTCGKQGQSVPVGVGQPTLRINQMTVGGMMA